MVKERKQDVFRFVEKLEREKKEYGKTKDIISFLRGEDIKEEKKKNDFTRWNSLYIKTGLFLALIER